MSDPNIAEKYYGKLKALGEETIADFVWNQALEIKHLQTTNQQLVEAMDDLLKIKIIEADIRFRYRQQWLRAEEALTISKRLLAKKSIKNNDIME